MGERVGKPGGLDMARNLEVAFAAGSAAGDDRAKGANDCPFPLDDRAAERLMWFSGFTRARRRHRG